MSAEDLYRKLQQHLDRMPVGFPATESGVEIRILRHLFTPRQAVVALELSAIPESAGVIHRRLKPAMSLDECTDALNEMAAQGLLQRVPIGGVPHFGKLPFAIGMYERQVNRLTPEFERDAREYLLGAFREANFTKKTTQMRTVPVNQAVEIERGVATYDDIREHVRSSPGPFAKMNCICRQGKDLLGEPCKQTKVRENCLMISMAAEMMVEHGTAHFISQTEMLQLLDEADKEGLVLQPENTKSPLFVCCCCGCCCGVLNSAKQFSRPADYFSATYCATVDVDACGSCGTCQTRCQMDAILTEDGPTRVDDARCIGCALCVTTCPSGAMRLRKKDVQKVPPDDTQALYVKLLRERYGPLGAAKVIGRKLVGMKF
jgi:Na+-translocating ferredoxin:NAD+ oxidoreductase subunit B